MDLKELSLNDKTWRRIAFNISGCKDTADEIVQEMYLKLCNINKDININYVTLTMRSIFLCMKSKALTKNRFIPVDTIEKYDLEDNEIDYDKAKDFDIDYEIVKSVFNSLPFYHKVIIEQSYIDGVRKFSRDSKIYVNYITKTRKKFKEKVWQEKKRNQQDLEMLLQKSLQQLASNSATIAKSEKIFLM